MTVFTKLQQLRSRNIPKSQQTQIPDLNLSMAKMAGSEQQSEIKRHTNKTDTCQQLQKMKFIKKIRITISMTRDIMGHLKKTGTNSKYISWH